MLSWITKDDRYLLNDRPTLLDYYEQNSFLQRNLLFLQREGLFLQRATLKLQRKLL